MRHARGIAVLMSIRASGAIALVVLLAGCTAPSTVAQQPSATTSTAAALSPTPPQGTSTTEVFPNFPDLTGFRERGMTGYEYGDLKAFADGGYYRFSTPDGLRCQMKGWNSGRGGPPGIVECWGSMPGTPDWARAVAASNGAPGKFFDPKKGPEPSGTFRPLPPKSTLRVNLFEGDYMFCAVGDVGMTACRMGYLDAWGHGFVLSPQGSWTF
ncbi:hypothetical protein [Mycobacterium sp. NPDC050853]|uniref:hypothetical protein n=1 Tax=Mycobacterium sp. NPDC050853 TaxID=3155160 RepID=UPI0033EE6A60